MISVIFTVDASALTFQLFNRKKWATETKRDNLQPPVMSEISLGPVFFKIYYRNK